MQFLKCSNLQEANRLLDKIHAQPEIAADIAAGRYDRYCDPEQLLTDAVGEKVFPIDERRGNRQMWDRVFDQERVGTVSMTPDATGTGIQKIVFKDRELPDVVPDKPGRP